jgi:hypothetical protein
MYREAKEADWKNKKENGQGRGRRREDQEEGEAMDKENRRRITGDSEEETDAMCKEE